MPVRRKHSASNNKKEDTRKDPDAPKSYAEWRDEIIKTKDQAIPQMRSKTPVYTRVDKNKDDPHTSHTHLRSMTEIYASTEA